MMSDSPDTTRFDVTITYRPDGENNEGSEVTPVVKENINRPDLVDWIATQAGHSVRPPESRGDGAAEFPFYNSTWTVGLRKLSTRGESHSSNGTSRNKSVNETTVSASGSGKVAPPDLELQVSYRFKKSTAEIPDWVDSKFYGGSSSAVPSNRTNGANPNERA